MTVEWTAEEREAAALALHADSCVGNDCNVDVDDLPDSAEWRQANAVLVALSPSVAAREADLQQMVRDHWAEVVRECAERDALRERLARVEAVLRESETWEDTGEADLESLRWAVRAVLDGGQ